MKYKILASIVEKHTDIFPEVLHQLDDESFVNLNLSNEEYLILKLKYELDEAREGSDIIFAVPKKKTSTLDVNEQFYETDFEVFNILLNHRSL